MPNGDPRDGFPYLTPKIVMDSYIILIIPALLKKAKGILQSPPSVRLSVMLSPPKPLDEIQPNLVCGLLT